MSVTQPFMPKYGSGQALTAAAASASTPIDPTNNQVRVVNTGGALVFVRTFSTRDNGGGTAATIADMAIPPGMASTLTKALNHDQLAYISPTGTTLQVMTGEGF